MNRLKNHPFAIEAFFERSLVLTFALPEQRLASLVPDRLSLDIHRDKWAFLAVAMVQTTYLRPRGFPAFLGHDFFLTGYRVFVRYQSKAGKNLRGLYILRSETDSKRMEVLGNLFTHYNYRKIDINTVTQAEQETITSIGSGFRLVIDTNREDVALPQDSPFRDWKTARRFAGPLPHTFTCSEEEQSVLIVQGVRKNWTPTPIRVLDYSFAFLEEWQLEEAVLANAFVVEKVPYYWKKGVVEQWK